MNKKKQESLLHSSTIWQLFNLSKSQENGSNFQDEGTGKHNLILRASFYCTQPVDLGGPCLQLLWVS